MIFITGAASVGKTSVIKLLKQQLPDSKFDIHDIDEADKWTDDYESWRDAKIEYWLKRSIENSKLGIETILCGIIYAEHVIKAPSCSKAAPIRYILLDASPEIIEQRFTKRMKDHLSRQKAIQSELRIELCDSGDASIIDTAKISAKAVAKKIMAQL